MMNAHCANHSSVFFFVIIDDAQGHQSVRPTEATYCWASYAKASPSLRPPSLADWAGVGLHSLCDFSLQAGLSRDSIQLPCAALQDAPVRACARATAYSLHECVNYRSAWAGDAPTSGEPEVQMVDTHSPYNYYASIINFHRSLCSLCAPVALLCTAAARAPSPIFLRPSLMTSVVIAQPRLRRALS